MYHGPHAAPRFDVAKELVVALAASDAGVDVVGGEELAKVRFHAPCADGEKIGEGPPVGIDGALLVATLGRNADHEQRGAWNRFGESNMRDCLAGRRQRLAAPGDGLDGVPQDLHVFKGERFRAGVPKVNLEIAQARHQANEGDRQSVLRQGSLVGETRFPGAVHEAKRHGYIRAEITGRGVDLEDRRPARIETPVIQAVPCDEVVQNPVRFVPSVVAPETKVDRLVTHIGEIEAQKPTEVRVLGFVFLDVYVLPSRRLVEQMIDPQAVVRASCGVRADLSRLTNGESSKKHAAAYRERNQPWHRHVAASSLHGATFGDPSHTLTDD